MTISKKFIPASLTALLIAGVLTGCPSKENEPANKAVTQGLNTLTDASYNFSGYLVANVKKDENALIGTKGGLTEEQAEEELDFANQIASPEGQNAINMINNGKLSVVGATDSKDMKYETILTISYELNGVKASFEVPTMFTLKDDPTLYVDPKAAKAYSMLPPQIGTKLLKFSVDDIPGLSKDEKAKFKAIGTLVPKYSKIVNAANEELDASLFKEIDVTDEAKQAGAVRLIELTVTPELSEKMGKKTMTKILAEAQKDFNIPQDKIAKLQEAIDESNDNSKLIMGDTVNNYGLNDKGQIVYINSIQHLKGAKHTGDMQLTLVMNYDKPNFIIDPAKQGSISVLELMMMR